jgi:hypothetical protein
LNTNFIPKVVLSLQNQCQKKTSHCLAAAPVGAEATLQAGCSVSLKAAAAAAAPVAAAVIQNLLQYLATAGEDACY